jgi:hypothetical protein
VAIVADQCGGSVVYLFNVGRFQHSQGDETGTRGGISQLVKK